MYIIGEMSWVLHAWSSSIWKCWSDWGHMVGNVLDSWSLISGHSDRHAINTDLFKGGLVHFSIKSSRVVAIWLRLTYNRKSLQDGRRDHFGRDGFSLGSLNLIRKLTERLPLAFTEGPITIRGYFVFYARLILLVLIKRVTANFYALRFEFVSTFLESFYDAVGQIWTLHVIIVFLAALLAFDLIHEDAVTECLRLYCFKFIDVVGVDLGRELLV